MTVKTPIYMDYAATCPVDERVLSAMLPYFTEHFGNAASRTHKFGWVAEEAVENARKQVAGLLNASAKEIVFTSGATESNNLAIKGTAEYLRQKGNHIITCVTEHKAVIDPCKYLERSGCEVTWLGVDAQGMIDFDELERAFRPETILVSLMTANNETGVIQDIARIGAACRARKVLFHTDAVQAYGKIPLDVEAMNVDLLSLSGHKIYGPKGIGALYVRRRKPRVRLAPQILGGGHERGNRSGTLAVPLIVGLGAAAELAANTMADESTQILGLREHMRERLCAEIPESIVNGSVERRLPGTLNVSFAYVEGESLLMGLKDVAVSSGSACTSASLEPSYVLRAMGLNDELAHSSLRITIGRMTTREEVDYVVDRIKEQVERLRAMSPLWEMVQDGIDLNSIEWTAH
ncbi:IscS subfamily cysteine desulfurase [Pseudenhygromyxa sp. WMMC2535]|uniref:IscS subfamily cysteine desulfurase n=1 Tax=Pseudenhygromyxa sp. WMMC2535 TaxID=2712867 RepID=UPI001555709C|nr:IscS subfamily cysteine desulfurase [Pseudenhygromyxa sp. WMMC2535]NVB36582.1 IscS subfamily cysteine desulfurase [Pseudenhygromyxa sp. WMMC2535]